MSDPLSQDQGRDFYFTSYNSTFNYKYFIQFFLCEESTESIRWNGLDLLAPEADAELKYKINMSLCAKNILILSHFDLI